jgi:hypothetical protein
MAEAWSPVQTQVSCCPWEASPPLMAEAWSPVQIQLSAKKYLLERQLWYSVLISRYVHTIKIEVPGKVKN